MKVFTSASVQRSVGAIARFCHSFRGEHENQPGSKHWPLGSARAVLAVRSHRSRERRAQHRDEADSERGMPLRMLERSRGSMAPRALMLVTAGGPVCFPFYVCWRVLSLYLFFFLFENVPRLDAGKIAGDIPVPGATARSRVASTHRRSAVTVSMAVLWRTRWGKKVAGRFVDPFAFSPSTERSTKRGGAGVGQ